MLNFVKTSKYRQRKYAPSKYVHAYKYTILACTK